jgi:arylsulfatase A-like enzyme
MYQGKVSHVDDRIGRILAALDAGGFARDTVVVLFSDHGVMLGEYGIPSGGAKPSDVCSRIPMIWRVPGARRGAVNSGLVSTVDIMPTLLELAGVAAPAGVQGLSLRPLLEDRATRVREDLLMEGGREGERPGAPNLSKTLIAARHKLTLYADPDEAELYDLQDDPHELRNLYTRPEAADLRRELTERLARRIIRSQNPLPLRVAPW